MRLKKDGLIRSFRPRSVQIVPQTVYVAYFGMRKPAPQQPTGQPGAHMECD